MGGSARILPGVNYSMLVAELTAPREFRLAQQDLDDPGPGEVRVRVDAVGICGSDVHSYAEGRIGDTPCQFPMVLGHEPAGTERGRVEGDRTVVRGHGDDDLIASAGHIDRAIRGSEIRGLRRPESVVIRLNNDAVVLP